MAWLVEPAATFADMAIAVVDDTASSADGTAIAVDSDTVNLDSGSSSCNQTPASVAAYTDRSTMAFCFCC